MPEELLDDTEVGAPLEEMGRKRVPEPVRVAEEAANGARVEAASPDRKEDGVVRSDREGRSAGPEVPRDVLTPRVTWADPAAYDAQATQLAEMFRDNFRTFEPTVTAAVRAAGPNV